MVFNTFCNKKASGDMSGFETLIDAMLSDKELTQQDMLVILDTQISEWTRVINGRVIHNNDIEWLNLHMTQLARLKAARVEVVAKIAKAKKS